MATLAESKIEPDYFIVKLKQTNPGIRINKGAAIELYYELERGTINEATISRVGENLKIAQAARSVNGNIDLKTLLEKDALRIKDKSKAVDKETFVGRAKNILQSALALITGEPLTDKERASVIEKPFLNGMAGFSPSEKDMLIYHQSMEAIRQVEEHKLKKIPFDYSKLSGLNERFVELLKEHEKVPALNASKQLKSGETVVEAAHYHFKISPMYPISNKTETYENLCVDTQKGNVFLSSKHQMRNTILSGERAITCQHQYTSICSLATKRVFGERAATLQQTLKENNILQSEYQLYKNKIKELTGGQDVSMPVQLGKQTAKAFQM